MVSANDANYDDIILIFSEGDPPKVRDTVNPVTLLSWEQVDNELRVSSCIIDDDGEPGVRSMKVNIEPRNGHAIRTLKRWLPSGTRRTERLP